MKMFQIYENKWIRPRDVAEVEFISKVRALQSYDSLYVRMKTGSIISIDDEWRNSQIDKGLDTAARTEGSSTPFDPLPPSVLETYNRLIKAIRKDK